MSKIKDVNHVLNVAVLMQGLTAQYITAYALSADNESSAEMYVEDVEYNIRTLKKFLKHKSFSRLQDELAEQDTLVREYYYKVFKYIKDNKLSKENYVI